MFVLVFVLVVVRAAFVVDRRVLPYFCVHDDFLQ